MLFQLLMTPGGSGDSGGSTCCIDSRDEKPMHILAHTCKLARPYARSTAIKPTDFLAYGRTDVRFRL